jgi:hypothetical protein
MDLAEAKTRFERAMGYCDDIIAVHQGHGGGKRGLRTKETSLNRAVVVLAVAAWQSVVQDLTMAALDHAQPKGAMGPSSLLRGQVDKEIGAFSTPNSSNTRSLLKLVDYDPYLRWTWTQKGGQGRPAFTVTSQTAEVRTDGWLRLRHDIAHGHQSLSVVEVLQDVRQQADSWMTADHNRKWKDAINHLKSKQYEPSLRLVDAKNCVAHFRRLAQLTAEGLIALGVPGAW